MGYRCIKSSLNVLENRSRGLSIRQGRPTLIANQRAGTIDE